MISSPISEVITKLTKNNIQTNYIYNNISFPDDFLNEIPKIIKKKEKENLIRYNPYFSVLFFKRQKLKKIFSKKSNSIKTNPNNHNNQYTIMLDSKEWKNIS